MDRSTLPSIETPRRWPGHRARARQRGFTLIELTVVVILVGVFAAMAIPQVTVQLRDRRVHEMAQRVALIYQQARLRAMGQGGAILVHYDNTTGSGKGVFVTKEGLVGGTQTNPCALGPVSNCSAVNWTDGNTQNRTIESVDVGTEPGLNDTAQNLPVAVYAELTPDSAAQSSAVMELCFTPLGRSFVRYGTTGPFSALTGVPQFSVFRGASSATPTTDSRVRTVLILPTGTARLAL
ncbi:MAG TPA: type II secretion system protein [Polyangiaceae bacterium]|nr:type II secretion system protein [Polyangiaceae bacterium]